MTIARGGKLTIRGPVQPEGPPLLKEACAGIIEVCVAISAAEAVLVSTVAARTPNG